MPLYPPPVTGATGANPTASVGLTAVNGVAVTYMRSDAAPALDQTAAYAFSGLGDTTLAGGKKLKFAGTTAEIDVNGSSVLDYNITNSSFWSLVNLNVSNAAVLQGVTVNGAIGFQSRGNLFPTADGEWRWRNNANSIVSYWSIPASNTWQLGQLNAASPVAQTLQAQGSRAGTDSNVGGAGLTVTSGNGTGTGTRSVLTLQTPVTVASGTGAQTQTTGLRIDGGTAVSTGYTVATLPATPLTGARAHVTDALAPTFLATIVGGGLITTPVFYNGSAWVGG